MVYLSTCSYHFYFHSLESYCFLSTGLLPPGVGYFLGFYSFSCNGKWDCFLNFSFDLSLLVYGNGRYFCVFILYHATLPSCLISSSSFLVASLGFFVYSIMSSTNSDSFTSFPVWISFISFFLLLPWLGLLKLCWIKVVRVHAGQNGYHQNLQT